MPDEWVNPEVCHMRAENERNVFKIPEEEIAKIVEERIKDSGPELLAREQAAQETAEYDEQQIRSGKTAIEQGVGYVFDWWVQVALGEQEFPSDFMNFIALWQAFNGLLNLRFPEIKHQDYKKVCLISEDSKLKEKFVELLSDATFKSFLDEARNLCPIYDVEGGQQRGGFSINEPYNLHELLELIYHIRCNLFHGEKSGGLKRDIKIVRAAWKILLPLYAATRSAFFFEPRRLGGQ